MGNTIQAKAKKFTKKRCNMRVAHQHQPRRNLVLIKGGTKRKNESFEFDKNVMPMTFMLKQPGTKKAICLWSPGRSKLLEDMMRQLWQL